MLFDFRAELSEITPKVAQGAKIYVFGTGANWENICKQYKVLTNININDCIDGFIDNDVNKQGSLFHNRPVYALSDINTDNAIILISVLSIKGWCDITMQLTENGMFWRHSFFPPYVFMALILQWEYKQLLQFKNKHNGQRCFIIGNGPSLTASDLNMLKDEVTFASNNAYLMFSKTQWRPSYYVTVGYERLVRHHKQIREVDCTRFYALYSGLEIDDFALSGDYFFLLNSDFLGQSVTWKPKFSDEAIELHDGSTVTYECIQLAAYMGFNEIYLLGVDNNYSIMVNKKGELITSDTVNHFTPEYGEYAFYSQIDIVNASYKCAREYAGQHNIKICNATRGGKLEIFERVDFDSLF